MNKIEGLVCKQIDFSSETFRNIVSDYLIQPVIYHRKLWEFVYIIRMLELSGMVSESKKGLGFGCGYERLVPALAAKGVNLTVTDLEKGWFEEQEELNWDIYFDAPTICDKQLFNKVVTLSHLNMSDIPDEYLQGEYDFIWSSCSLEHLGGLLKGMEFIINSLKALKVNGVAIHTTEYNISANNKGTNYNKTLETPEACAYRKLDFTWLANHLAPLGYKFFSIDYDSGDLQYDLEIDQPPYTPDKHLKLNVESFDLTSLGFVIERVW